MITVSNLTIHFGARQLFSGVTFFIGSRERIGLVGKNGAGKSTLLKIMAGLQPAGTGNVALARGTTVGYLPQEMNHREQATVRDEAASAFDEVRQLNLKMDECTAAIAATTDFTTNEYASLIEQLEAASHRLELLGSSNMDEKIEKVLKGLGFRSEDMHRQMSEFSGGWKMRVELGKILLQSPDLLLLDEPTNHLDIESIQWLEEFLTTYPGSVVLISHDRTFLDNVTTRTIEISKGRIYDYKFAYSRYLVARRDEIEKQEQAAKNQQKYIEDTQKLIDKFRAKKDKAAFAQTLIRKLDKLERIEVDDLDSTKVHFRFPPAPHAGKVVLRAHHLSKNYGSLQLFKGLEVSITRGEKIALVGKNGVGKSTLVRILVGKESHEGTVEPGHGLKLGYYAQNQSDTLDLEKTVFETIDDEAVGDIRKNIRGLLGAFLFSGDDIDKKVKVLSGGEKARLALCKLLLEPCNMLVMDEPTNHLDLQSKEVLKEALRRYDGTLLVVSHDRDFLQGLTKTVYEIHPQRLKIWQGDILDFLREKRAESIALFEASKQAPRPQPEIKNNSKSALSDRKELEKRKRKLMSRVEKLEHEIQSLELRLKDAEGAIAQLDFSNAEYAHKILKQFEEMKVQLEQWMKEWEEMSAELNSLE